MTTPSPVTEEEIDEMLAIIGNGRELSGDIPAQAARIIRHLRSRIEELEGEESQQPIDPETMTGVTDFMRGAKLDTAGT